ncbi:MAG: hypothetical protein NZL95_02180 [Chitinophagales bacterium]|nr:hypothetical protein [Chitinophagales bacterium]MDW8427342.1 hypothetical protein [Chitinophagales bacterium]
MQVEPDHSEASKPVTIDHKYIRNHWQQYLEVFSPVPPDNNPPGVYGYRLKLKNKFPYDLDSLVILVSYYAGGECIAVNYVRMSAMSSGAQIFVAVPDNSHARTFRYQVRKVICRKAELCFDIDHLHFGDDPYRCAGSS